MCLQTTYSCISAFTGLLFRYYNAILSWNYRFYFCHHDFILNIFLGTSHISARHSLLMPTT